MDVPELLHLSHLLSTDVDVGMQKSEKVGERFDARDQVFEGLGQEMQTELPDGW